MHIKKKKKMVLITLILLIILCLYSVSQSPYYKREIGEPIIEIEGEIVDNCACTIYLDQSHVFKEYRTFIGIHEDNGNGWGLLWPKFKKEISGEFKIGDYVRVTFGLESLTGQYTIISIEKTGREDNNLDKGCLED